MKSSEEHHAAHPEFLAIRDLLEESYLDEIKNDIRFGMTQPQKSIPSKYFYDARGSWLFEQICCTPEYYLTGAELSILEVSGGEMMRFFAGSGGCLVELGSGANTKIKRLLDALHPSDYRTIRYVPVDISESALIESSRELSELYPGLGIVGILADFTRHTNALPDCRKMILFLGSTIGNFPAKSAESVLGTVANAMNPADRFLVGMDMLKPVEVIHAAYNDKQGITRRFNLNILNHINRRLSADFRTEDFEHLAFFNEQKEQVEMHLRARRRVRVRILELDMVVGLDAGETILTEICRKFTRESAQTMITNSGLRVRKWFTDPNGWFSVVELEKSET